MSRTAPGCSPGCCGPTRPARPQALSCPEGEESDTLGGLVTERLGRLPEVGDAVVLSARDLEHRDANGLPGESEVELAVDRMDGYRIDRLRLRRTGGATAAGPGHGVTDDGSPG